MLRGIGIANAIESAGGPHRKPLEEGAEIRFDPGGSATLLLGSHNHGQGHETVFTPDRRHAARHAAGPGAIQSRRHRRGGAWPRHRRLALA